MDKYSYTFDFGTKPTFIIDAWFRTAFGPVLVVSGVFFPLCAITSHWITKFVFPSIAGGAIIIFVGIYLYRRHVSIRRIKNIEDSVFHYEIDTIGIHFRNEIGEGVLKWGFKGRLIPKKTFILLQSSEIGFIPLPIDTPPEILSFIKDQFAPKKRLKNNAEKNGC